MKTKGLPFVHLIKTPMNNYAYDVNTNAFIGLSDDTYSYLEEVLNTGTPELPAPVNVEFSLEKLSKQGFFSDKHPKRIEHGETQFLKYHLNENLKHITLQLTQECNFRCSYCTYGSKDFQYQREHSSKKMPLETAISAIDFFAAHSANQSEVNVGFYGGEPLLEYDMMKTVIEYAEKKFFGKELTISFTTNGSLLTLELARYFSSHNASVTISLDGAPETHNRSRKFAATGDSTFDTVKKNLDEIKKELPEWFRRILLNVVIDPRYSCCSLHDFFSNDATLGQSQMVVTYIDDFFSLEKYYASDIFSFENNSYLLKAYLAYLGKYPMAKTTRVARQFVFTNFTKSEKNLKMSMGLFETNAPGGPCIPGERRLFVSVDGLFYPCERVSETSELMIIGNLREGFDVDKAKRVLNVGGLTDEECKNCWAFRHCSICVKHCDNNGEFCPELKLSQCDGVRESVERSFKEYLLLRDFDVPIEAIINIGV